MQGASVLVVDDDADVRALVCELLARAGYEVSEAPNGREALRLLYDERPDLIVLDVSMPELDGWATLERVREVSSVPVVMLSALGAELQKVRALRAGADDYVTKPFGPAGAARPHRERPAAVRRRATCASPMPTSCWRSTSRSAACARTVSTSS
jgi:DNA-binding response OmpR family regulator